MNSPARILIIDDDPLAIQMLHRVLGDVGDIRFAASGAEALHLLQENLFDLVLLDAQMPAMDGLMTCKIIKQDYPDVPVIFVTAATDPGSEIKALEAGAADFINKPLNPPVIRARVNTHLKLKNHTDMLRALVKSDPITGIANRRALVELTESEWSRALRNQTPLSLLMIDIDDFKAYHDHYGHLEGDTCLCKVAQTINATVSRAGELVARYGGDEFAGLLPGNTAEQAAVLAEKIRAAVCDLAIPHVRSRASDRITISIGAAGGVPALPSKATDALAPMPPNGLRAKEELFNRADAALYAAKSAGRNRVAVNETTAGLR